jgi:putative membrane protein
MRPTFVPYCGHSPVPGALAWNIDPMLISILCAAGLAYLLGCRGGGAPNGRERAYFGLGLLIAGAAFLSPLCNLSVALFSARVTQHIVLTLIAAPLIVLGRPASAIAELLPWSAGRRARAGTTLFGVTAACAAFAAAMWTWHMPAPYDETLRSNSVYWLMHVTTFGSALAMWHFLLPHEESHAGIVVAAVATGIQLSLLGALLTLAPSPLFVVHLTTTWPWGLSPLQDQQLGGIIMWVPAGTLFTAYGLAAFAHWLNADDGALEHQGGEP